MSDDDGKKRTLKVRSGHEHDMIVIDEAISKANRMPIPAGMGCQSHNTLCVPSHLAASTERTVHRRAVVPHPATVRTSGRGSRWMGSAQHGNPLKWSPRNVLVKPSAQVKVTTKGWARRSAQKARSVSNGVGKEVGAWLFRECAQASTGCIGDRLGIQVPAAISTLWG
jgi:hypothetical protein